MFTRQNQSGQYACACVTATVVARTTLPTSPRKPSDYTTIRSHTTIRQLPLRPRSIGPKHEIRHYRVLASVSGHVPVSTLPMMSPRPSLTISRCEKVYLLVALLHCVWNILSFLRVSLERTCPTNLDPNDLLGDEIWYTTTCQRICPDSTVGLVELTMDWRSGNGGPGLTVQKNCSWSPKFLHHKIVVLSSHPAWSSRTLRLYGNDKWHVSYSPPRVILEWFSVKRELTSDQVNHNHFEPVHLRGLEVLHSTVL